MNAKYLEVCKTLGYRPESQFVTVTTRGTIGFTCGKPAEIRELHRRVVAAGMKPAAALVSAATR